MDQDLPQSKISRRQVFHVIAGIGALQATVAVAGCNVLTTPPEPGDTPFAGLDKQQAVKIGEAYLSGAGAGQTYESLQADLFPRGWSLTKLKQRAAADFKENRMFVYRGWRISEIEGKLFALTALSE